MALWTLRRSPLSEDQLRLGRRVAFGLFAMGLVIQVLRGLREGLSLESYAVAWAAVTGSVWFAFDKIEVAAGPEKKREACDWLFQGDLRQALRSVPSSFIYVFDEIFGERHLSWRCFLRSSLASLIAVTIAFTLWLAVTPEAWSLFTDGNAALSFAFLILFAGVFNFVPDYLSLLETRWAIEWMEDSGHSVRILLLDFILTALLSASLMYVAVEWIYNPIQDIGSFPRAWMSLARVDDYFGNVGFFVEWSGRRSVAIPFGLFYYSAFVTSLWLWLYVLSVAAARVLLGAPGEGGFILRASDVERHPFRSIGYVAVTIVSVFFGLGLPFVIR